MSTPKQKSVFASPVKKKPAVAEQTCIGAFDDIFWVQYPKREIFMRIDLDGDILNNKAHRIEFSPCGTIVKYSSRIPEMMMDTSRIFPEFPDTNAFKYHLDVQMNERKKKLPWNPPGSPIFECQKSVKLPYPVQNKYFDRNFKEIPTYEIIVTPEGAAYTYFWLMPL